ncbi:MAG TPA: TIGR01777 family protein [Verrucomicrobiales bacterium]|nr:TIGR01777 family protein [Verrucomicrobiales bacterium]
MNILITGSSGLIGTKLCSILQQKGHRTVPLLRHQNAQPTSWDPENGIINIDGTFDVVIHLAGAGVASGRWSKSRKEGILNSRVQGTRLIAEYFSKLEKKPHLIVSSSAIGYYGNRGDELLDEDSSQGSGFLSDVCRQWEDATAKASEAGIRVVNLRIGVVLSTSGGALKKMLLPFRMCLGGKIGNGSQYFSWVSIQDIPGAIEFILTNDSIKGPVNLVSPAPISNTDFTKALGTALKRPTPVPLPAFMVKLLFGKMGDECLLSGAQVMPGKLLDAGYTFEHPDIDQALDHLL